jgi:dCTP deaminase
LILTDREIKNSIASGLISIDPAPADDAYSSTSVDLTLAPEIRVFKDQEVVGLDQAIDPKGAGYKVIKLLEEITDKVQIHPKKGFVLEPRTLLLAWTQEHVDLREHGRVAARVEGKSSLARVGLGVHVTAPTIHSGFAGPIQLELVNHGPLAIKLSVGLPICQLIFEQTLGMPDRSGAVHGADPLLDRFCVRVLPLDF